MQLIITKDKYSRRFVYDFLPGFTLTLLNKSSDRARLNLMNDELGFNALNIITYALKNIRVSETNDSYVLKIDKNLRFEDLNVDKCVNLITYGTREMKGCPIVLNIFNAITNNLDMIYERWNSGR